MPSYLARTTRSRIIAALSACAILAAAPASLAEERAVPLDWSDLHAAKAAEVEDASGWRVVKSFGELDALDGAQVRITGHAVALESGGETRYVMLLEHPGADPFHGPGHSAVEVSLADAIPSPGDGDLVVMEGRLELVRDGDTTQLYRLSRARRTASDLLA